MSLIFKAKKDMLIPEMPMARPIRDGDGNELSGDEILLKLQSFSETYIKNQKEAVPNVDPIFVEWLNQYKKMRADGKSADEIIRLTVARKSV